MPREIFVPPAGPPQNLPFPNLVAEMGEQNLRQMFADFYERLSRSEISSLFPTTKAQLQEASQKSADFFVSIMGGDPDIFQKNHGEPQMRRRHLRFAISERERSIWLRCFFESIGVAEQKLQLSNLNAGELKRYLTEFSAWMVNTEAPC